MAETQRANPLSMPMTASYNDPAVAFDELGREVRMTRTGQRYLATDLTPARPQATAGRGLGYNILDNIIGYDDGVDTPGERLGASINAIASDPIGAARGAVTGIGGLLGRLVSGTGTMGDVIDATGLLATGGQMIAAPAGSMRIFAGRNSRTADLDALARAQELSARRRSPEEIWSETGWFKGVDGQWRYEIPDDLLTIDPNLRNQSSEGVRNDPYTLIRHQRLANAYPDATDRLRSFALPENVIGRNVAGEYHPGTWPVINLRNDMTTSLGGAAVRDVERMAGAAAHELQHLVQEQEGFAHGAALRLNPTVKALTNDLSFGRAMEEALRRNDTPWLEVLRSDRPDVFDTWLNSFNEFPRSSATEISEFAAQMTGPRIRGGLTRENYRTTAGEVEAETVENRLRLTPEERAARPPWLDEPVPRDQQFIPQQNLGYNLPDQNLLTANLRGLLSR